jgi:hypothetical protein
MGPPLKRNTQEMRKRLVQHRPEGPEGAEHENEW